MRGVVRSDKVAETDATVLVRGESGTGKELVARELHERNSVRRNGSFVAVKCAALSDLIRSQRLTRRCWSAANPEPERNSSRANFMNETASGATDRLSR